MPCEGKSPRTPPPDIKKHNSDQFPRRDASRSWSPGGLFLLGCIDYYFISPKRRAEDGLRRRKIAQAGSAGRDTVQSAPAGACGDHGRRPRTVDEILRRGFGVQGFRRLSRRDATGRLRFSALRDGSSHDRARRRGRRPIKYFALATGFANTTCRSLSKEDAAPAARLRWNFSIRTAIVWRFTGASTRSARTAACALRANGRASAAWKPRSPIPSRGK